MLFLDSFHIYKFGFSFVGKPNIELPKPFAAGYTLQHLPLA